VPTLGASTAAEMNARRDRAALLAGGPSIPADRRLGLSVWRILDAAQVGSMRRNDVTLSGDLMTAPISQRNEHMVEGVSKVTSTTSVLLTAPQLIHCDVF
jgi:hypothetical protein